MKRLRGKKALITGAACGIGRAIALELARAGTDVYLLDVDSPGVETVCDEARQLGVDAVAGVCDVGEADQVTRSVASVLEQWGTLDILVNNAGVLCWGTIRHITAEQWQRTLAVNLHGPIQFIHELLPTLLERDEAHILNVCSMNGLFAMRKLAPYQTSKFALVGLTESLRADLRKTSVGATALCPGFVSTDFIAGADTTDRHGGSNAPAWMCATPEQVARKAVRAIRRNQALTLVTPTAKLLWLAKRISPWAFDFLRKYT